MCVCKYLSYVGRGLVVKSYVFIDACVDYTVLHKMVG